MGEQELLQQDVFDAFSSFEENSFHAAVVDFPWEIIIKTSSGDEEFRNAPRAADEQCRERDTDKVMFDMVDEKLISDVFEELNRILTQGAYVICFADDRFQEVVRESMRESELILRRNWAWSPNQIGTGYYGRVNHYPIPVATNGETNRYVQSRGTLYEVGSRGKEDYPTAKPVELYRKLLSPPVIQSGEALLEPFCGTAPGGAIAVERDLDYVGIDVNDDAMETARSRVEQKTLTSFKGETQPLDEFE